MISTGVGTYIDPSAKLDKSKTITIGDHCFIGAGVQILCDLQMGDYCRVHNNTTLHGYKPCTIGHNAWIGQFTIIDSIGGCTIGDNFGVGAHSQLWSHIKYGDTLEGCQFNSNKPLTIGKDVWLTGHCITGPVSMADKSMALAGSVITQDMEYNQVYAGTPAKAIGKKQFIPLPNEQRMKIMQAYIDASGQQNIKAVMFIEEVIEEDDTSYFVITERKYTKKGTPNEVAFMKYLLPEKAKFTPL